LRTTDSFIKHFSLLGDFLRQFAARNRTDTAQLAPVNQLHHDEFERMVETEHLYNPWFTTQSVQRALMGISRMLEQGLLHQWLAQYELIQPHPGKAKTVGLVMAGNIPLVGFHDLLCVLATGHRILAKPSAKDDRLIRKLADVITAIDPVLGERIAFTNDFLKEVDAIIATGSNNSARYFEYYFREIPHIIRKNRNGVAVISGKESEQELALLGDDIFTYFGLGCRNVTKLYVPHSYDLKVLLGVLDRFNHLGQHHKYWNNVDYYRSVYLMNQQHFLDNGVLLLKEDKAISSPVGVVFYERYSEIDEVRERLREREQEIQCVVSLHPGIRNRIPPGSTQEPMPWDYADGVDTIRFLAKLR
jgi:hypothetical protein